MKNNRNVFAIERMAKLFNISRSSYYNWLTRRPSNRALKNKLLLEKIHKIFDHSKKIYGAIKITQELSKNSEHHNKKKIARLMSNNGLFSIRNRKFRVQTTVVDPAAKYSPNLLDRNFHVTNPNKVWVSDITYIQSKEKLLYLCVIIDLFSRKVIGWSIADNMRTNLVMRALIMAYRNRKPSKGLIFHSDRGSQYTSTKFRMLMSLFNMQQSMSRKGNCYDNACAESFFSCLKTEAIYPHGIYETEIMARMSIFQYIEIFFNKDRLHSYLGYKSPEEFELLKSA